MDETRKHPGDFKPGNPHAFRKGQSGNPGGRPKNIEKQFRADLAELEATDPDTGEVVNGGAFAMRRLFRIIRDGVDKDAMAAIRFAFERGYGLPKQSVDMTVADVTDEHRQMLDALKMTPYERRKALVAPEPAPSPDDESDL